MSEITEPADPTVRDESPYDAAAGGAARTRRDGLPPAWTLVLAGGFAVAVVAPAWQGSSRDVLMAALGVTAAIAIVAGVWRRRPDPRWPWFALGLGVVAQALGGVVCGAGPVPHVMQAQDPCNLLAAGLLAAALAGFATVRGASVRARRMLYVDSSAILVGCFALLWFFVIDPHFDRARQLQTAKWLDVGLAVADLFVLALAARLALTPALNLTCYRLLVSGVAIGAASGLLSRSFPGVVTSDTADVLRGTSYALLAGAALHPDIRALATAVTALGSAINRRRLVILGSASLAIPMSFFAQPPFEWDWYDVGVFTFVLVVVPGLVIYRLVDLVSYSHRLVDDATRASARLTAILDATPLPVKLLGRDGSVLMSNAAAAQWVADGFLRSIDPGEIVDGVRERGGNAVSGLEVSLRSPEGVERQAKVWTAPIHTHGRLDAVVAVYADVTEQNRREQSAHFLAEHDPLTGLLNRRGFAAELEGAVADASARPAVLALLDVDNFKHVNDSAGHLAGDSVLAGVAKELRGGLRDDDVIARLSGDEFAILLREGAEDVPAVAERLLSALRSYRLVTNEVSISVTASIGLFEIVPGLSGKDALARADAALYEAKERGRDRIAFYDDQRDRRALRATASTWSDELTEAIDAGRFVTHLQPIVELATGRVTRYEALARLERRDGSLALPGAFIPPAGRLGLMPAIDRSVLDAVVSLLERDPGISVSMNLDSSSFEDDALLDRLERILVERPGLPGRLGVEVTEHTTLRDADRAQRVLERLQRLGCALAIDDFGTGLASFVHLRELPADVVKISPTFVENVDTDSTAAALVEAIVTVAHALGKEVVAEGVERAEVAAVLRALHIKFGQGYFFGRPAPAARAAGRLVRVA